MSRLPAFTEPVVRRLILWMALWRHPVILGVRIILLDEAGRVFLVRHSYIPGWHLPGGGVERGETVRAAAVREVREEAGLQITEPPRFIGLYLNGAMANRNHVAVFVSRSFSAMPDACPDWEIVERGFFSPSALPDGTTKSTRARLAELLDGVPASETW